MTSKLTDESNPWLVHSSQEIYANAWIRVREDKVTTPANTPGIYSVVEFQNLAVGIVPIDQHGNTWLVGQWRYPLESYSWEIIEGGCPKGEKPEDCALRELKEEAGLVADKLQPFMELSLSNSSTDDTAVVYVATGLTEGEAEPEETEQLQLTKMPLSQVYELVLAGKIHDAISVAAILKLKALGYF
ncbi:nudix hydrolase [Catenovulum agarivorans DS-2]|uniref:GDP-mannose pyrophosphatase n=1 Tax=Catenovulum agarivorans DS-2 TaxID=1328313 RepID=W7QV39_9ALTE|nr:NUDIX hydrolase [Catenovulum agarivorans]EWH11578.1 nudix hydrolase [Catenovulum agarivorans DS-2]